MNTKLKEQLEQLAERARVQLMVRETELEQLRILEQKVSASSRDCEAYAVFLEYFKEKVELAAKEGIEHMAFTLKDPFCRERGLESVAKILSELAVEMKMVALPVAKGDAGLQDYSIELFFPQ